MGKKKKNDEATQIPPHLAEKLFSILEDIVVVFGCLWVHA